MRTEGREKGEERGDEIEDGKRERERVCVCVWIRERRDERKNGR